MEGGKKHYAVDNQSVRLSFFLHCEKTASETHVSQDSRRQAPTKGS
jgi:hypothetical protein